MMTKTIEQSLHRPLGTNKILRVIFNADLRCSHDGLRKIAKDLSLNVDTLRIGEFLVFINSRKSALKIFAAGQTIAHFKMPGERKMDMKIISMIPRFFNGQELKYDAALREKILKEFGKVKVH